MRAATTPSWRVKLRQGEKHFEKFKEELARYFERRPYEIQREAGTGDRWRYVLRVTEQPPSELSATMGDTIQNVRSALDHLAVALAPASRRRTASFPIVRSAISVDEDDTIHIQDDGERSRFERAVDGMRAEAVTIICELQPGVVRPPALPWHHPLSVVNLLNNADKHQGLVAMSLKLADAESLVMRGGRMLGRQRPPDFCGDGSVVAHFGFPSSDVPSDADVRVEFRATPKVLVGIGREAEYGEPAALLPILFEDIPRVVFDSLEPFVRS